MATLNKSKPYISARVGEYSIPPIRDMLVLGKDSPIGCLAMRRALDLLVKTPYAHFEMEDDDIISDILVRQPILKRISKENLIDFVLTQIKPLLGSEEVLHVELSIDVYLSHNP